jgi:hypothetical protein
VLLNDQRHGNHLPVALAGWVGANRRTVSPGSKWKTCSPRPLRRAMPCEPPMLSAVGAVIGQALDRGAAWCPFSWPCSDPPLSVL